MNKVILHGNVGKDPESRKVNDATVTKFSLATNKTFTRNGEKQTETQWHNIVFWGKLAETVAKYVKKGTSLIVEGEISYRSYENKDGQTVYTTEIVGNNMHFTGTKVEPKPEPKVENNEGKFQKGGHVGSMSDINELPGNVANYDDIPDDLPY